MLQQEKAVRKQSYKTFLIESFERAVECVFTAFHYFSVLILTLE